MSNEIMQVGSIANQITSTRDNPQRYRVYLVGGVSPALNCMQGGGLQPFIVDRKKKFRGGWKLMCSTTTETTPAFTHFHKNYYPTIKANPHDVGVVYVREK